MARYGTSRCATWAGLAIEGRLRYDLMMGGEMNKVILVGHLGRDPDMRDTSGTTVARMSVATNERRKRDGEWGDHTEWHRVVAFGRQAENAGQYLGKGSQIAIEGRLQTRKWQDRKGQDRTTTEVVADRIDYLGGRRDGQDSHRDDMPSQAPQAPPSSRGGGVSMDDVRRYERAAQPAVGSGDVPF